MYDPDRAPASADWLAIDEGGQSSLSLLHPASGIKVPNAQLHAVIHVIVENQVALGEEIVIHALARLRTESLSRHDALRAKRIGARRANLYQLIARRGTAISTVATRRLEKFAAAQWRADSHKPAVAGGQTMLCPQCHEEYSWESWCARRAMSTRRSASRPGADPDVELVLVLATGDAGLIAVAKSLLEGGRD